MSRSDNTAAETGEEAIIRVAAFHNEVKEYPSLVFYHADYLPDSRVLYQSYSGQPCDASIVSIPTTMTTPPASHGPILMTGSLGKLPVELLTMVFQYMDVGSCVRLRHVCRRTREVVSNMVEYRAVMREAASLVVASFRTGIAEHMTLWDLYQAMCTRHCQSCHAVGHYVYLLRVSRCCRDCLDSRPEFRTVTLASFTRNAGISEKKVRQAGVGVLTTIERRIFWSVEPFTPIHTSLRKSVKFINFQEATRLLGTSPQLNVGRGFEGANINQYGAVASSGRLPFFDRSKQAMIHSLGCRGCLFKQVQQARMCQYPHHTYHCQIIHYPIPCSRVDCQTVTRNAKAVYMPDNFMAHFRHCPEAMKLWADSQQGTVPLPWLNNMTVPDFDTTLIDWRL